MKCTIAIADKDGYPVLPEKNKIRRPVSVDVSYDWAWRRDVF